MKLNKQKFKDLKKTSARIMRKTLRYTTIELFKTYNRDCIENSQRKRT